MAKKKETPKPAPVVTWKEGTGEYNYIRAHGKRAGKGEAAYRAYIVRQAETYRGAAPAGLSEPQIDEIVAAFEEKFGPEAPSARVQAREKPSSDKVQTLSLSGQTKSD